MRAATIFLSASTVCAAIDNLPVNNVRSAVFTPRDKNEMKKALLGPRPTPKEDAGGVVPPSLTDSSLRGHLAHAGSMRPAVMKGEPHIMRKMHDRNHRHEAEEGGSDADGSSAGGSSAGAPPPKGPKLGPGSKGPEPKEPKGPKEGKPGPKEGKPGPKEGKPGPKPKPGPPDEPVFESPPASSTDPNTFYNPFAGEDYDTLRAEVDLMATPHSEEVRNPSNSSHLHLPYSVVCILSVHAGVLFGSCEREGPMLS